MAKCPTMWRQTKILDQSGLERIQAAFTTLEPRRKRRRRRQCIDVKQARKLYDDLGSWRKVSEVLLREDGTPFTPNAIASAVSWSDNGNAGRRQFGATRSVMEDDDI